MKSTIDRRSGVDLAELFGRDLPESLVVERQVLAKKRRMAGLQSGGHAGRPADGLRRAGQDGDLVGPAKLVRRDVRNSAVGADDAGIGPIQPEPGEGHLHRTDGRNDFALLPAEVLESHSARDCAVPDLR